MLINNGFTLDTLLAIISCITGIIALFVGGYAYKRCKINNISLNDKKRLENNCDDNSQKAAGNIVNINGISGDELTSITNALTSLNNTNFSIALDAAYTQFQQQCDDNLKKIIEKTDSLIKENKLQIGGYTKIDWIHVFFESAKNSSDLTMQNVWAQVLATELSLPDSFSYKTLYTLKNMSSSDYLLFEKMCPFITDGFIYHSPGFFDKYELYYIDLIKLSELGLINITISARSIVLKEHGKTQMICNDKLIIITNTSERDIKFEINAYILTSVAKELIKIVQITTNDLFVKDFMNEVSKQNNSLKLELHQISYIENNTVHYQNDAIYSIG